MTKPSKPTLTLVPVPSHTSITVAFGPTRSRFFERAVAHARAGASELTEPSPGRFRARFVLHRAAFAHLGALSSLVRHWRGTEISAGGLPVAPALVQVMGFCAADQLTQHGVCRLTLDGVPLGHCGPCPLFDPRPRRAGVRSRRAPVRPLRLVGEDERVPAPKITRFTVVCGPSRSWDLERALALAGAWAQGFARGADGSWRAEFVLGEDPRAYHALEAALWLLVQVRGTDVTYRGRPIALGQAILAVRRARQHLRPVYVVPPPRDVASLLVDDI